MSEKFFAVDGSRFSDKDAAVIGPELVRISKRNSGAGAADIVRASRKKTSPLRKYFRWGQDAALAAEHRLHIARHMAGAILIKVKTKGGKEEYLRAFHLVRVKVMEGEEGGEHHVRAVYFPATEIVAHPQMSAQVIERARRELVGWGHRYRLYKEVLTRKLKIGPVFDVLDQLDEEGGQAEPAV